METLNNISTQNLAYLGDAVFELWVRSLLTAAESRPVQALNRAAKNYVSAGAQSIMYHRIYEQLKPEEQMVMKRGRNLNPVNRAKRTAMTAYRHATGLEVLFGYLYAEGQLDRINEIFALCAAVADTTDIKGVKYE